LALSCVANAQNAPGAGSANASPAQQEQGQGNAATDYRALAGQFKPAVVRRVKWDLNKAGYYAGPMDSSWGPDARDALTKWQQAHGLEASGEIDTATLKALDVRVAPVPNGNDADKGAPLSGTQARGAVDPGVAEPPPTPGADGAYERVQEMQKNNQENNGGAGR
jgi:hypothetical protein